MTCRLASLLAAAAACLLQSCAVAPQTGDPADAPTPTGTPAVWPRIESAIQPDPRIEARAAELLARMTVEEKVGQMMMAEIGHVTPDDVRRYHLGAVLNGGGSAPGGDKRAPLTDWVRLADSFHEASVDASDGSVAIPILWGTDAVHGHNNVFRATLFPHNIGLGAANNPALIGQIAAATAREVAATGIDWVFAPTLAVARDDRWGRTFESYSEDPAIVRDYAGPAVEGLQGRAGSADLFGPARVIATAKHFVGEGGTLHGIDRGDARVGEPELRDVHGQGYFTALAAGAQTVMATFNSWQGRRVHGDRHLLTGVLKEQMGFDGFLVTDWNAFAEVEGCSNRSCSQAINAGVDMLMVPQDFRELIGNTLAQLRSGEIPAERVDDAVTRILRVKLRAGLFERGKPSSRPLAGDESVLGSPAHRAIARQAVRESLVMLKNHGGVLPIGPGRRVLVAGDGADDIGKQSGGWTLSWQGTGNVNADFPGATSIFAGIRAAVSESGGEAVLDPGGRFDVRPDVAIVVFGEEPYAEFKGDRQTLDFSAAQPQPLELLRRLKAQGIPVVSVLITGRPLWVSPELDASDAFVVAWLPGSEGAGVADVLVGDRRGRPRHDFKGRLSFSWPAEARQADVNRGDPGYAPLFPYGFGLGYGAAGSRGDDLAGTGSSPASTQAAAGDADNKKDQGGHG